MAVLFRAVFKRKSMIGLGFRRDFSEELIEGDRLKADFIEFAPENWMEVGGHWGRIVKQAVERFPVHAHGLSLSVGSPEELDYEFLGQIKKFPNCQPSCQSTKSISFNSLPLRILNHF